MIVLTRHRLLASTVPNLLHVASSFYPYLIAIFFVRAQFFLSITIRHRCNNETYVRSSFTTVYIGTRICNFTNLFSSYRRLRLNVNLKKNGIARRQRIRNNRIVDYPGAGQWIKRGTEVTICIYYQVLLSNVRTYLR